jgi:lectin, mannose-binding 2
MVNNGSLHYDHDRDGTHTQLAGCEAKFRNYNQDTHVSIIYKDDTLIGMYDVY